MPNDKSKLLNEILLLSAHPDGLQSEERQVGHVNVNLDIDIFVISEPKWLKLGLQAPF